MFENFTYEYILDQLLGRISSKVDTREGSVIYDALAPAAMEIAKIYVGLDMLLDSTFADSASYEYLVRRAAEHGILPRPATKAILKGVFQPKEAEIPVGSKFWLDNLTYVVQKKLGDGIYQLECEEEGEIGNKYFGEMIPIDYMNGLERAELTELLIPGEDEEEEDAIRNRYFASFRSQVFGGNAAEYKERVGSMKGVGGVKVIPAWNGGGTVKLVILNSDLQAPSKVLLQGIKEQIDPEEREGRGYGLAPIGHRVTVAGVEEEAIDIKTKVILSPSSNPSDAEVRIHEAIADYYREMTSKWEESEGLIVRLSQIEMRILNVEGVIDITDTMLNDTASNVALPFDKIPIKGECFIEFN